MSHSNNYFRHAVVKDVTKDFKGMIKKNVKPVCLVMELMINSDSNIILDYLIKIEILKTFKQLKTDIKMHINVV